MELTREQALALLRQYNEEPFHLRHALTVEAVMNWFARELGYGCSFSVLPIFSSSRLEGLTVIT